jgi:hypothetical protein
MRLYVPFLTMSGSGRAPADLGLRLRVASCKGAAPPDIVLCRLQTVQKGKESVAGFVATASSLRWRYLRQCFLLHGKCRL